MTKIIDASTFIFKQIAGKTKVKIEDLFAERFKMQEQNKNILIELDMDDIIDYCKNEPNVKLENGVLIRSKKEK